MHIQDVISELKLFSDKIISFGEPVTQNEIDFFLQKTKFQLPEDYLELLRNFNGVALPSAPVYGIVNGKIAPPTLEDMYDFEHHGVDNAMFEYLIPFSPDGGGNHYCFDTRTMDEKSCKIVFWQHDYIYSEGDPPEVTHPSFSECIKEVVINWTLDSFDYNGNLK